MRQNDTPQANPLSVRQLATLFYPVSSPTVSEAASLACVARATLHRWLNDPVFRSELERLGTQAAELAAAELNGLMLKAAQVVANAMEHPHTAVRIRASHIAMVTGLKLRELKEPDPDRVVRRIVPR